MIFFSKKQYVCSFVINFYSIFIFFALEECSQVHADTDKCCISDTCLFDRALVCQRETAIKSQRLALQKSMTNHTESACSGKVNGIKTISKLNHNQHMASGLKILFRYFCQVSLLQQEIKRRNSNWVCVGDYCLR